MNWLPELYAQVKAQETKTVGYGSGTIKVAEHYSPESWRRIHMI